MRTKSPTQQLREAVLEDALLYLVEECGEDVLSLDWSLLNRIIEGEKVDNNDE